MNLRDLDTSVSPKRMLDAYNAGIAAARRHMPFKSNPFERDKRELWLEWRKGYLDTLVGVNENQETETN